MFNISNFLEKFVKLNSNSVSIKKSIIKIIRDITNIQLNPEELEIKEGKFYLNCKPIIRNHIFTKKDKIILELRKINIKVDFY